MECGQHWEQAAEDVAIDTTLRFLAATGSIDAAWARAHLRVTPPAQQRLVRVTEAVVARAYAEGGAAALDHDTFLDALLHGLDERFGINHPTLQIEHGRACDHDRHDRAPHGAA